jgi:hypothetical protein
MGPRWSEGPQSVSDQESRLPKEGPSLAGFWHSLGIDRRGTLRWEGGPGEQDARIDPLLE